MTTNIIAIILGLITILCLAVFHTSQKRKKARFREELVMRFSGAETETGKEEVR
ncbi:MAG: hypothetical protein Q4A65_03250 [Bacillota bacterium]|nr:hypothetical protein [Bacillota bacterium]